MIGTIRATAASGAISVTVSPEGDWQIEEVRVHLNAAGGAGTLTVTQDANAGAEYDTVLDTQDMTAVANFLFQPTRPHLFSAGDKVVIAWANANNKTYGVEVKYSLISG